MEETPDTVVSLVTGKKIVVKEDAKTVLELILDYRRKLGEGGLEIVPKEI